MIFAPIFRGGFCFFLTTMVFLQTMSYEIRNFLLHMRVSRAVAQFVLANVSTRSFPSSSYVKSCISKNWNCSRSLSLSSCWLPGCKVCSLSSYQTTPSVSRLFHRNTPLTCLCGAAYENSGCFLPYITFNYVFGQSEVVTIG